MMFLINYGKSHDAVKTQCNVVQVNYTRDIHDTQNMVECDCGKHCTNQIEGTCVKIYISYAHFQKKIIWDDLQDNHNGPCTFAETKCKDVSRSQALIDAKKTADHYLQYNKTNSTIPCYIYNDE